MAGDMRGPRAKIERAKHHVHKLEVALGGEFFVLTAATRPDAIVREEDHAAGHIYYKVGKLPAVPDDIPAVAGDVVHNLRAALDLLMGQLIVSAGNTPEWEYFPVAGSRKKFVTRCKTEIEGRITKDAFDALLAAEAYRGGKGDALWRIHKLDIEDKHRLLFVFGIVTRSQTLTVPLPDSWPDDARAAVTELMGDLFYRPADRPVLNEGDVLYSHTSEHHDEPKFRMEVAFAETKIVQSEPVLPTLTQYVQAAERVVESFASLVT